jgi:AGZA family xanthine/uracil permease-like MFS transporter
VPPYATGPALILVGALMILNITKIPWANVQEAVPAFLTMIIMPFTYSVAYGFIAGIISYIIINGSVYLWNLAEAWLFPATRETDPTLKRVATWKIARQMTFSLDGWSDDEGSSNSGGKDVSNHGSPAEAAEPAAAPADAAAKV